MADGKTKFSGTNIMWIVIAVVILGIILVNIFKPKGPPPLNDQVSQKVDNFQNNLATLGAATNPLTDDQVSAFVSTLGGEYQSFSAKYTPLVADIGQFDGVVRQMTSQAQFKQVSDAYNTKYGVDLMDDVTKAMTYNPPLWGSATIATTSANTYASDIDFLNALPQT